MDMIGYLGKKVDIICKDGKKYAGHVFELYDAEDSDIGCDSIEIAPIDEMHLIELPIDDIESIEVDSKYKEFDFRH